ncbi:MAG: hypothetical protein HRF43_01995 [Phycisphaerae bacterium]|jgi:hypothetical protein
MSFLLLLGAVVFTVGISWGLPSRAVDPFLFGDRPAWSGETILQLAGGWSDDPSRGADVDRDPLAAATQPVVLNATDAQRAQIILRYRLATYQPDEIITMRSLAGMRPGEGRLDPRLYQYGGLWIYPVGALLKVASLAGLVALRTDVAWYLDRPEQFGRFYVVARAYSAAWGLVGLWAVFWITRRLSRVSMAPASLRGDQAAVWTAFFAGLCYIVMPVVVNMAHEAKPHLPGAALQLLAIAASMKYAETAARRWWLATAALCGAAFGMVLSAWPIFIVLPVAEWARRRKGSSRASLADPSRDRKGAEPAPPAQPRPVGRVSQESISSELSAPLFLSIRRVLGGGLVGLAVYFLTNPYMVINLFVNRAVLRSNFGNSLAMYEIGRWREGLVTAARLVGEGASPAIALVGGIAAVCVSALAVIRLVSWPRGHGDADGAWPAGAGRGHAARRAPVWLLAAPSLLILVQFVALAAGKPGEYGRFAVLPDVALAVAAVTGVSSMIRAGRLRWAGLCVLTGCVAVSGLGYVRGFLADCGPRPSRIVNAHDLDMIRESGASTMAVQAEPAPYLLPPVNLFAWRIVKLPRGWILRPSDADVFVQPVDDPRRAGALPEGFVDRSPARRTPPRPISWSDKPLSIRVRRTGSSESRPGPEPLPEV